MDNIYSFLNLSSLPEFEYVMIYQRVTEFGDYEGAFSISAAQLNMSHDLLKNAESDELWTWVEPEDSYHFESELVAPVVFEDRELGYLRAVHSEEGIYGPSSKNEFAPLIQQLAPLLLVRNGEDYRRSLERNFRIFEWLVHLKKLVPKKFDWLGLYFHADYFFPGERGDLVLGPFIGEPTEHVRIPLNRGFCGLALSEERVVNVADVSADERHIACSLQTRSEIVIPLKNEVGEFIAELDIDSNAIAAFTPEIESLLTSEAGSFHELL